MQPTILPFENFCEDEDAQTIKNLLEANPSDIGEILIRRSNSQRQQIQKTYKTMFGEDLVNDLKNEISGDSKNLILKLLKEPLEYQAEELYKAINGSGTDDDTLVEILLVHNNDEVLQISEIYQKLYENSLEDDIKDDESGTLKRLLVSLSSGGRDESESINRDAAIADALALHEAGEASWGTEESVFNSILCLKNKNQLKLIFDEYETLTGNPIENAIDNEFSGSTKRAFLSLVACIKDKQTYLATRLHDSLSGLGTDEDTLIRIIISRSEIDLEGIKMSYEIKYSKSLAESVADDCSGQFLETLLAIIG